MRFSDYLKPNKTLPSYEEKIRDLRHSIHYETDLSKKEKSLLTLEEITQHDPVELHYAYIYLLDLYYKQRSVKAGALERCIDYCQKDIAMYPLFIKIYADHRVFELRKNQALFKSDRDEYERYENSINETLSSPPKIGMPSFKRLAIIYEKQGKYNEAISICEKAIEYELTDDTKSGYSGRKQRLLKKL